MLLLFQGRHRPKIWSVSHSQTCFSIKFSTMLLTGTIEVRRVSLCRNYPGEKEKKWNLAEVFLSTSSFLPSNLSLVSFPNSSSPVYPLIYHDISAEIPAHSQPTMLNLYRLWLLLVLTLILNLVGCVFLLIQGANDGATDMINSIVYLPVISITSFLLWYRPIYNGFMKEHSLFYYMYFLFCGFHLAFSLYLFLGIPSTGSCGLLNTISSFTSGKIVAAILGTVTTVAMAVQGLGNAWYYREIWKHNHEQGHTFQQAKQELATHGAKAYL